MYTNILICHAMLYVPLVFLWQVSSCGFSKSLGDTKRMCTLRNGEHRFPEVDNL